MTERDNNDVRRLNFLIDEGYVPDLRRLSDDTWTLLGAFCGDTARDAIDHCMGNWPDDDATPATTRREGE